jgi:hypothetical protein
MDLRRGDREQQLRTRTDSLRRAIDGEEKAALRFEELAAQQDSQLDELAALEAAGRLTADDATSRLAKLEATANGHRRNAEQRRRVAAARAEELERLERELAEVPFNAKATEHAAAAQKRARVDAKFADQLAGITKTRGQLTAARKAERTLRREAERLKPEWVDFDVDVPDEKAWPDSGVDELVELLQAGPITPARRATKELAEQTAYRERHDRNSVRDAVTSALNAGGPAVTFERLPEHLRDEAWATFRAERDARLAEMSPEARAAFERRVAEQCASAGHVIAKV